MVKMPVDKVFHKHWCTEIWQIYNIVVGFGGFFGFCFFVVGFFLFF